MFASRTNAFAPTRPLGVICLQPAYREHFGRLMDVGFTATMEEGLDKVAEGGENWVPSCSQRFYLPLQSQPGSSRQNMALGQGAEWIPACPAPNAGKLHCHQVWQGRGFPWPAPATRNAAIPAILSAMPMAKVQAVNRKGAGYMKKSGSARSAAGPEDQKSRTGSRFIACMGYPDCHYAASISTGVTCPACGEGQLGGKRTQGQDFLFLRQVPQMRFRALAKACAQTLPRCGSAWLVEKGRNGTILACPQPAAIIPRNRKMTSEKIFTGNWRNSTPAPIFVDEATDMGEEDDEHVLLICGDCPQASGSRRPCGQNAVLWSIWLCRRGP